MPQPAASILFVDDDPDVRKTAELLLKKAGNVFWGAATPEEAMSRLVSDPEEVVLLDLNFAKRATAARRAWNAYTILCAMIRAPWLLW